MQKTNYRKLNEEINEMIAEKKYEDLTTTIVRIERESWKQNREKNRIKKDQKIFEIQKRILHALPQKALDDLIYTISNKKEKILGGDLLIYTAINTESALRIFQFQEDLILRLSEILVNHIHD